MDKNQPLLIDIAPGLSIMAGLPRISTWKTAGRPQKAVNGTFGFNTQTNSLEYFNGSRWLEAPLSKA